MTQEELQHIPDEPVVTYYGFGASRAYQLTQEAMVVDRDSVPSDYLIRMEKGATKFLLLEYNPQQSANLENINILKTQRRGDIRYLPFVTTLESIQDE